MPSPGADPAHEVGGTTHRPDQPQIPEGLERLTPVAEYQEITGRGFVKVASMQSDPDGDFVGIRDLAHRLAEQRSKATDAAKFAEREYERVCEGRDSVTESYERMKHACLEGTQAVLAEVEEERDRQNLQWGGPEHDIHHGTRDWAAFLVEHLGKALDSNRADHYRRRMVQVAALAIAAIESHDAREKEPTNAD